MEGTEKSPWLAVTIGILGMIVGYSLVLAQSGSLRFETAVRCPSHAMNHRA